MFHGGVTADLGWGCSQILGGGESKVGIPWGHAGGTGTPQWDPPKWGQGTPLNGGLGPPHGGGGGNPWTAPPRLDCIPHPRGGAVFNSFFFFYLHPPPPIKSFLIYCCWEQNHEAGGGGYGTDPLPSSPPPQAWRTPGTPLSPGLPQGPPSPIGPPWPPRARTEEYTVLCFVPRLCLLPRRPPGPPRHGEGGGTGRPPPKQGNRPPLFHPNNLGLPL